MRKIPAKYEARGKFRYAPNMCAAIKTVDEYLSLLNETQRNALLKLREQIREIVPDAEEVISYQVPTFKKNGGLVAYAAFKSHCSFFVMSTRVTAEFAKELAGFPTAKSTVRFTPERPLPQALIEKLVRARLTENASGRKR